MSDYRRAYLPGGTFFFTVVTYKRKPILTNNTARMILHDAFQNVINRFPFTMDAICLLPDHLHCIWSLPEGDSNYAIRWKEIKRIFSRQYNGQIGCCEERNESREERQESTVWQRRYWEHTIRDEKDFLKHVEYIHYNPVKHGLVNQVHDWEWSSFHRYVAMGMYDASWGEKNNLAGEFGE
jgi:putative transposase